MQMLTKLETSYLSLWDFEILTQIERNCLNFTDFDNELPLN